MLIDFSDQLYQKLIDRIAEAEPTASDPIVQFKTCLRYTKQALAKLELHINENPLSSETEQRQYIEQILPRFRSLEFYYYELAWLVCNRPKGDRFEWMEYYRQELDVLRHFLNRHAAYYQVYKIQSMGLEEILSEGECKDRWIVSAGAHDALPVQERTALFSKFIAYDKLQDYLLDQIRLLNEFDTLHPHGLRNRQLHWTGDVCNLVELVYGLYETKQINNGEASLTDLVNCMELMFQVNLTRVNRVFIDIKRRKVMSQTRFLEQMRTAIKHKIDQDDAYIPMSFRQGYAKHNN
jgi:hypothetical protein